MIHCVQIPQYLSSVIFDLVAFIMSAPFLFNLQETFQPIMCSYKLVDVSFDVWGLGSRVESYVHKVSDATCT